MHDIPEAGTEAPAAKSSAEDDAMAAAYEADSQPSAEEQDDAKPSGLMFVRHNRSQNRVA